MHPNRSNFKAGYDLVNQKFSVLDYGEIRLVDYIGSDEDIVANARTSYHPDSTRKLSDDETLIRYLFRHRHTTPAQTGIGLKLYVKLPIFVERQWVRHRTASHNEVSARYSAMPEEYYIPPPEQVCHQDKKNRQGRAEPLPLQQAEHFRTDLDLQCSSAFSDYRVALRWGMARETARLGLPLNTYTEKVWWMDLHNLFHFLKLRMDKHAQWEIREYANIIGEHIVAKLWPISWQAFLDYELNAMRLTALDIEAIRRITEYPAACKTQDEIEQLNLLPNQWLERWKESERGAKDCVVGALKRNRERDEFFAKAIHLGIVADNP